MPSLSRALLPLFPLALAAGAVAHADTKVELTETVGKKTVPVTAWTARQEWKWSQTSKADGNVPILQSLVTLTPRDPTTVKEVKSRGSKWLKNKKKSAEVQLLMPTLTEEIALTEKDGGIHTFSLALAPSASEVISTGCAPFNIELIRAGVVNPAKKAFYLGVACSQSKQGILVTITAPKDVGWGSTTIFEVAGKGEQWRQYVAPPPKAGGKGELGKLDFVYMGVSTSYLIVDRKAANLAENIEGSEDDDRVVRFRIAGGAGRLAVGSSRVNDSLFHLGISLDAETRKFFKVMKAELGLDLALPLQTGSLGGDFFDLQAALMPEFRVGSFTLSPGLYFISMLGHYASGTLAYQFNQPGIGLEARWLRPRGSYVMLRVSSSGALPSSSNSFLGAGLSYRFPQGALGRFGIELVYRGVILADPSGVSDTMSESLLNFVWSI